MLNADFFQLPKLKDLQVEPVGIAPLKEVAALLFERPLAGVPVHSEYGNQDVGVCARPLLKPCHNNDLIFDWHQTPSFAGKALDHLGTLKDLVVAPFPAEWYFCIAPEEIPAKGTEQSFVPGTINGLPF